MTTRGTTEPTMERQDDQADPRAARDRRVVRRALRAGAVATAVLGVVLGSFGLASGGGAAAAVLWVVAAAVVGTLVASAWLVLALLLDLVAGELPGRRRLVITGVVFACAFVSPGFLLAAELAASRT